MFNFAPKTINFMGIRGAALAVSALAAVLACVIMWQRGLNYGIDFVGGLKLAYQFTTPAAGATGTGTTATPLDDVAIQETLGQIGINASVQRFRGQDEQRYLIKVRQPEGDVTVLVKTITEQLQSRFGPVVTEGVETLGPRVGAEMRIRSFKTVLYVLLALLLYIGFRFDFLFAPGAIVATAHDVIITMGVLALLGIEFNLTILAAILTIAGYSINDTIVIYDRVRERVGEITPSSIAQVLNRSLSETLPRTLVTGMSTIFAVLVLYFVAGGDIRDFALTFFIGIIAGTYSSLFVATPIYMACYQRWPSK